MTLTILASGSDGNAAVISSKKTKVLVDAGLGRSVLFELMMSAGIDPESLTGILISHEHLDHSRGAVAVAQRLRIKLYATEGTMEALKNAHAPGVRFIQAGSGFGIGDIWVHPFPVHHDAADPVGFTFEEPPTRTISIATDLGEIDYSVASAIHGSDVILLEANHSEEVLRAGPYAPALKRRVLGPNGHLSNEQVAEFLTSIHHDCIVVLGHISTSANRPELARLTIQNALNGNGLVRLKLAQEVLGKPI